MKTAYPLVHSVFHGGKATCFAYGQVGLLCLLVTSLFYRLGVGKHLVWHTTFVIYLTYLAMLDANKGLYMLAARDIFHNLQQPQYSRYEAFVSFYEIYQGHLYDLLNERKRLFAREDGNQNVVIQGIAEFEVHAPEDLMDIFERGSLGRSTGKFFKIFILKTTIL
jgi:hypothetical protein